MIGIPLASRAQHVILNEVKDPDYNAATLFAREPYPAPEAKGDGSVLRGNGP
jgi:hypothetical protein